MTENRAVFAVYNDRYVLMHIKDNRAEHIYAYDPDENDGIGTIINCRVENSANSGACFVRYSASGTGFVNKKLKGQTVLPLMYKKDGYSEKKASFTDELSIEGAYTIVFSDKKFVKISSKIPQDQKNNLFDVFNAVSNDKGIGIIVRTKTYTEEDGIQKALEEIDRIKSILNDIKKRSEHTPAYTVLYRPLPSFVKDLLYLCDMGIEEIVTDNSDIRKLVENTYEGINGPVNVTDRVGLRFYEDPLLALSSLYSFSSRISEALSRKVYLKSGAYITFDVTEALTAIDINTSGSTKRNDEESFKLINTEAAGEIVRQIILRNTAGIIIIDFINMKKGSDYDDLKDHMKALLKEDRCGGRFVDFTPLGLCELTRKRTGKSLSRIFEERKDR